MNMIQRLATTKLVAPTIPASDLQGVLVALQRLHDHARQAQWISAGPPFRAVHLDIDEIYGVVREHADSLAERILPIVNVIREVLDDADVGTPPPMSCAPCSRGWKTQRWLRTTRLRQVGARP